MTSSMRVHTAWSWAISALAVVVSAIALCDLAPSRLVGAGVLLISLILAKIIPVDLPGGGTLSLVPAADIACALALGPAGGAVSLIGRAIGDRLQDVGRPGLRWRQNILAGAAPEVLASLSCGYASRSLGFSTLENSQGLQAAILSGLVYLAMRVVLLSVTNGLRYNTNPARIAMIGVSGPPSWGLLQLCAGLTGFYVYRLTVLTAMTLVGFTVFAALVVYAARLYMGMHATYWSTILALIPAIEAEFTYGEGHSRRVAAYCVAIARKLLLRDPAVSGVYIGALLHDIGMAGMDDRIVNKPSCLSAEEFSEIARHIEIGDNIVRTAPFLRLASGIVKHHHERWDGHGYPDGLRGVEIPLGARIVAVADAFEALSCARPYSKPLPVDAALPEIEAGAGTQFDPAVTRALKQAVQDELRWGRDVFEQHYSVDLTR